LIVALALLAAAELDPAHWFASRPGLLRVYEDRSGHGIGTSCEVLSARPREGAKDGSVVESCTMIVARKAKPSNELTYALRPDGVVNIAVKPEGSAAQNLERLVLPGALRAGTSWKETRGQTGLTRTVRSAGGPCRAAGRGFADCLVVSVTRRTGRKWNRYNETYAAGVGLVEDDQWQLIDVKGL
jgi:hypothetical protein